MKTPSQNASETASTRDSPKIPQRQRGKERVAALLAAAADVFVEKGYDAATMTEIAAKAGASIGSLYQFFPTKELLADDLHDKQIAILSAMLTGLEQEIAGKSPSLLADKLFDGLSAFVARNPVFVVLADRRPANSPHKQVIRGQLRGHIARILALAEPPLPPDQAEVTAIVVVHMIKAAVTLAAEVDLESRLRDGALDELRGLLRSRLEGR